jgi:hypothetical protein
MTHVLVHLVSEDYDPERLRGWMVHLGDGHLDSLGHGPRMARVIPGVPELLRTIADQLESGMTTGPDEGTSLAGDPDVT